MKNGKRETTKAQRTNECRVQNAGRRMQSERKNDNGNDEGNRR